MSRSRSESSPDAGKELQAIVHALVSRSAPTVLATLVEVEGSSYRRPGARLLVFADGTRVGSISGGCLEEDLLTRARQVATTRRATAVVYDTTSENDLVWGVGLGCHGVVRILIEPLPPHPAWATELAQGFKARRTTTLLVVHGPDGSVELGTRVARDAITASEDVFVQPVAPPTRLVIFGAGDDARPLVRLAKELGWAVTVGDPRAAFATRDRFPEADDVFAAAADQLVAGSDLDDASVVVVMTHHYVHDVPLLRDLLPRRLRYLGLLGPKKRAEKILGDLAANGMSVGASQRQRLHAPVGLDIGADAPEQVALSIVSEIQAALAERDGRPLRQRTQPIHAALETLNATTSSSVR